MIDTFNYFSGILQTKTPKIILLIKNIMDILIDNEIINSSSPLNCHNLVVT